ncbi:hypothetical protein [Roseisolibacter agri]|uniref:Uncharacterized protein n=1 Tax=Roseisolibacter agri TaxID=2014610 RepID=A0AA37QL36_9BACT|nr:hypothetical protein [Roseisolibacter agri]GLC28560.1 hypothetical protein rosag_50730 [Roseisolibacter agri]
MKKHSPRPIPDFSRHPQQPHQLHQLHAPGAHADDPGRSPAPMHTRAVDQDHRSEARDRSAPPARVKPHATSQKSGRRGQ